MVNRQFGALSGLAIILIVLNHSIHMGTEIPQQLGYPPVTGVGGFLLVALQQLGPFGVPIFLFISGCFVVYVAQNGTLVQSYKATLIRLKNILVPYLIWSVVFYILIYEQLGQGYSFLGYVKNLLVGYPFNFVPLLVFYYLLSPLLVRLGKRFGAVMIVAIGLYQLILINLVHPGILGFRFPDWMQVFVPRVVSSTLADWAIFLPLGIVFGLHSKSILPWLHKVRWVLAGAAAGLLVLAILYEASILDVPLAVTLAPVAFIGLVPLIKRDSIPMLKPLEWVGRMSYGLYLMNLIVADALIWLLQYTWPAFLSFQIVLEPFLFVATLAIPLLLMRGLSRLPMRGAYRYVFG
jgi:peptidoglycan/LPS O-acetylase OafA/YrhL